MPYREKMAWLSLAAMVVAYGLYFVIVASGFHRGEALPGIHLLGLFAAATAARGVVYGVGYFFLIRTTAKGDRMPPDERDVAIERHAMSSAYYVLIAGIIYVGCILPFNSAGWTIVNSSLFMIVAAEIVRTSVIAASYRRQA